MAPPLVLMVAPYYAPHIGGVEAYVAELSAALTATGAVRVGVLAPQVPGGTPLRDVDDEGTPLRRFPAFEAIPNYPVPQLLSRAFWRAVRGAVAARPDVVVSHTRFFTTSVLAGAIARMSGARWVHVEHGSTFVELASPATSRIARTYDLSVGRLVLRGADERIAISAAVAGFVSELSGRRAVILRRGLRFERLDRVAPDTRLAEEAAGRPVVTYVGRLIGGKGVHLLLEAVRGLDAVVCVIGEGPQRAELEEAARASGQDVRFLGELPEDVALRFIKAADVVVNPSLSEGLPTTVLLAAFFGRAIVATDVGGTREVVEDGATALVVPARDALALRGALQRVIADPALRAELGAAAARDVRERFDWADAVDGFLRAMRVERVVA